MIEYEGKQYTILPLSYIEYQKYVNHRYDEYVMRKIIKEHITPLLSIDVKEKPKTAEELIDTIFNASVFYTTFSHERVEKNRKLMMTDYNNIYDVYIAKYGGTETLLKAWDDVFLKERIIAVIESVTGVIVYERIQELEATIQHIHDNNLNEKAVLDLEIRAEQKGKIRSHRFQQTGDVFVDTQNALIEQIQKEKELQKKGIKRKTSFNWHDEKAEEIKNLNAEDAKIMATEKDSNG